MNAAAPINHSVIRRGPVRVLEALDAAGHAARLAPESV